MIHSMFLLACLKYLTIKTSKPAYYTHDAERRHIFSKTQALYATDHTS